MRRVVSKETVAVSVGSGNECLVYRFFNGELKQQRWRRQRYRHKTKGLMSMPSSAKQQREITKFKGFVENVNSRRSLVHG